MVAMQTGWTPDVMAELPDPFRRACHWTVYARAIAGEDGLPNPEVPKGASLEVRLAVGKQRGHVAKLRTLLFPEDDGG